MASEHPKINGTIISPVANFSAACYTKAQKDLGKIAMTYKNIYTASTCLLADSAQALKALLIMIQTYCSNEILKIIGKMEIENVELKCEVI